MDDAAVPEDGRIFYVTPGYQKLLKSAEGITRTMSVGAAGVIDRRVHTLDDVKLKLVPSGRFKILLQLHNRVRTGSRRQADQCHAGTSRLCDQP